MLTEGVVLQVRPHRELPRNPRRFRSLSPFTSATPATPYLVLTEHVLTLDPFLRTKRFPHLKSANPNDVDLVASHLFAMKCPKLAWHALGEYVSAVGCAGLRQ
eukprot:3204939-Rhodomonas_salina.1